MADEMEMRLLSKDERKLEKKKKRKELSGPPTETDYQPVDWKTIVYSKKYIPIWILCVVIIIASVLLSVYQEKIIAHLRPFSAKVRNITAGWLIPIAILFVLSFPPLMGDEIVEILCGVIYGLWIGFGIVAAGHLFGQIGNWFLFKYALRRKSAKLERTNLNYGAMARMVREGGLWIIVVIRLSAIPPHFSTAVFSTCDVKFWHFLLATFLSLPKQIFLVYLGTLLVKEKKKNSTPQTIVLVLVLILTIAMALWIWKKMKAIKTILLQEQEQRRRAKQNVDGRDEEEGIDNEWSSLTNDVRNDGPATLYGQGAPYDQGLSHDRVMPYGRPPVYGQVPAYDPLPAHNAQR